MKNIQGYIEMMATVGIVAFITFPTLTGAPTQARVLEVVATLRPEAKIIFGGDMMFDRTVRAAMDTHGPDFVFSCVKDLLASVDLVVANLEGPITEHPSVSLGSVIGSPDNFTFTFPSHVGPLLQRHNIRVVNLGNNHILNFGWEGEHSTKEYLEAAQVGYFGDPLSSSVRYETVKGVRLAFINFNEFAPGGWSHNAETAFTQIQAALHERYMPIVYTHWGDEYVEAPERVKNLARSFIDAGAAIVIGSHPHVVQEHEVYKGHHIYYSLGNFVFDQYWKEAVKHGLLLKVTFMEGGVERLEEIPIDNQTDRRTCVL